MHKYWHWKLHNTNLVVIDAPFSTLKDTVIFCSLDLVILRKWINFFVDFVLDSQNAYVEYKEIQAAQGV
jgi:hypothetical protein